MDTGPIFWLIMTVGGAVLLGMRSRTALFPRASGEKIQWRNG